MPVRGGGLRRASVTTARPLPAGGRTGLASDAPTLAVIDFETTGLSPALGARATEVAAVLVCGERIVDTFDSLMHSGNPMVEQFTHGNREGPIQMELRR